MAGTPKYFGRYYKLTLDPPEGNSLVFETEEGEPSMDIKFDVTYARGQTAREGTISVLGLSMDTMHTFLELAGMTRGKAMSELVHIRLDAGYFTDAGHVNILDGYAWHATITSPPNMWLEIKVAEYNPMGGRGITVNQIGPSAIPNAVQSFIDNFSGEDGEGVEFVVEDNTEDGIFDSSTKKITIPGGKYTIGDAIRLLNQKVDDRIQFILKTSDDDDGVRTVLAVDKEDKKATEGEVYVDGENGLLSVTGIDAINGCITTFLDGTWDDSLSHLNLTSSLNPQANGRYYIVKKQFVGHFLGQEWYARYFCSAREGDDED